jgi:hypothetical protein
MCVCGGGGVVKGSGQEAALRKWLGALEAVAKQLQVLGRDRHVSTLRRQERGVWGLVVRAWGFGFCWILTILAWGGALAFGARY